MKDKGDMTAAVTTSSPANEPAGKRGASADRLSPAYADKGGGSLQVFKPGEGQATRLGMMVVVMGYVAFACWHFFYNWVFIRNFLNDYFFRILTNWTKNSSVETAISYGGTVLLAFAGFCVGYYFIYIKRSTADFLIKTDGEMAKVTWPQISPWFKVETKVWGATYVVLIVVAALTFYVFGLDLFLKWVAQHLFYGQG